MKQDCFISVKVSENEEKSPSAVKQNENNRIENKFDDFILNEQRLFYLFIWKHKSLHTQISLHRYLKDLEILSTYYDKVMKSKDDPNYIIKMPLGLRWTKAWYIWILDHYYFSEGRYKIVFGNIKALADLHSGFLIKGLENKENRNASNVLDLLKKRKADLKLHYGKYGINYPRANIISSQFEEEYFLKGRLQNLIKLNGN